MTTDEFDRNMRRWMIENALTEIDNEDIRDLANRSRPFEELVVCWEVRNYKKATQLERATLWWAYQDARRHQG